MLAAVFCPTTKNKKMVNIKDVRIGNLFDWDVNETCVVEGIIGYQLTKDSLHLKGTRFNKPFVVNAAIGDVTPIKLNIYWFNKFDAQIVGDSYIIYKEDGTLCIKFIESEGYYYPHIIQIAEMSSVQENMIALNRIEFVHQLQNLLYFVMGEDAVVANGR